MPVLITVGRQASVELTSRSDESNELIIVCARVRAVQGGAKKRGFKLTSFRIGIYALNYVRSISG